ncbi:hypothetical protein HYC85_014170 [Camellia sinensis]|uniref:Uncharacterized protein n=1 Tax=Camellia sinensis TaxID=4442 RepID=A0A7J7H5H0_CAMSI|nr:hypothetical protein HYC85_014170 [Camellia sinensis]
MLWSQRSLCLSNAVLESHTSIPNIVTETQEIAQQRSQFLETEYRNKILYDLFEIKAFLNQWLTELTNNETLSLQHQVQAVAPLVLQQYSSDTIQKMLSDVSLAISSLTNRKTRDQIMILNSKRFLDRLVSTLEEKKHHQVKLKEGLKDLSAKRMELQNSLTSLWPKQPLVSGAAIGLEGQQEEWVFTKGECKSDGPDVPGIIGCHQALEAIKIASDVGEPLSRRMLLFDALTAQIPIHKHPLYLLNLVDMPNDIPGGGAPPEIDMDPEAELLPLHIRLFNPAAYRPAIHVLPPDGLRQFRSFDRRVPPELLLREPETHLSYGASEGDFHAFRGYGNVAARGWYMELPDAVHHIVDQASFGTFCRGLSCLTASRPLLADLVERW